VSAKNGCAAFSTIVYSFMYFPFILRFYAEPRTKYLLTGHSQFYKANINTDVSAKNGCAAISIIVYSFMYFPFILRFLHSFSHLQKHFSFLCPILPLTWLPFPAIGQQPGLTENVPRSPSTFGQVFPWVAPFEQPLLTARHV
jgi:hypothetical protein